MPDDKHLYDATVIGGGPAGATTAALLAQGGHRVLVVERERFPRFHIGESLLPASRAVLQRLGIDQKIEAEGFVCKRGATFLFEDGSTRASLVFANGIDDQAPSTYQVPRARFDQLLLDHARACGAVVWEGSRVADVELDGEHVEARVIRRPVESEMGTGSSERTVHSRYLVDASGQAGFLAKRLGLRQPVESLRNVALYAHYEGLEHSPDVPEGDIQIISRKDLSWLWLIPLNDQLTSVGAVAPKAVFDPMRDRAKESILEELIASTPVAASQMSRARRVTEARFEADFSYGCRQYAGDRWLVAGDAGAFLDPVFSTGVQLALESGLDAAEALGQALANDRARKPAFDLYERRLSHRYRHFARWVRRFYQPEFRDLLCQPTDRWRLLAAATSILAGNSRPSLRVRWRIALFFWIVRWHRHWPVARRLHSDQSS